MRDDVQCPYCGLEQEINHDDGYGYDESELHQQECSCGKIFTYETTILFSYDAYKADCLNGAEHDWRDISRFPEEYYKKKLRCHVCKEEDILPR